MVKLSIFLLTSKSVTKLVNLQVAKFLRLPIGNVQFQNTVSQALQFGLYLINTNMVCFSFRHLHQLKTLIATVILGLHSYAYLLYILKDTHFWKSLLTEFFIYYK